MNDAQSNNSDQGFEREVRLLQELANGQITPREYWESSAIIKDVDAEIARIEAER